MIVIADSHWRLVSFCFRCPFQVVFISMFLSILCYAAFASLTSGLEVVSRANVLLPNAVFVGVDSEDGILQEIAQLDKGDHPRYAGRHIRRYVHVLESPLVRLAC